jgi:hypothetical protein
MPDYRSMFDRAYLGAWDLGGKDVTVRIAKVQGETLNNGKTKNKKPVAYFDKSTKGLALNKTNSKAIAAMYGNNTDAWIGKLITLYPTQAQMGGDTVDAIRVRPQVPRGKVSQQIEERDPDPEMRARQNEARAKLEVEMTGREPGED